ncbi:hypothetical protein [Phormidium tenue]|uniref:Uncharacterized protein n=1 Tax=Phormidium tenue NIES-30 TaxID=549789 RepID=A0A1U7JAU0_9CYAN|nr:hypothetical protein [Phormidium tenue]MBD2230420.1 hypothetical protein [Phormidium tenue FACHB-1052]OKH50789.1 hypothetical protein NIES30_01480 [Phormidium tenue NIES-30]
MRKLQKALAGACLLFGLSITLLATTQLMGSDDDDWEDRAETGLALVMFGVAPMALGTWLAWHLRSNHQQLSQAVSIQAVSIQQEQLFLQLLQSQAGDLTIVQFAAAAQMPVEQAKAFLDQKAQVLNASFDVKDTGAIVYRFPL